MQIAILTGPDIEAAGRGDRPIGQSGFGEGQGLALTDQRCAIAGAIARQIGDAGTHFKGLIDAGEIKATHLPAAIGPHQCRGGQQWLSIAVDQSDGDALTRFHITGGAAQGGTDVAKQV